MMRTLYFFLTFFLLAACSPVSKRMMTRSMHATEAGFNEHAGLIVYDPEKRKTVFDFQSDRYFTPASNTKILTLFTALSVLPDSIPALRYVERKDSLIFWGMGDPSFLYKETFNNFRVYDFLKTARKPLYFSAANFHTKHFGPGWGWDDYNDYYSAEKSPFPVYGNCVSVFPMSDQLVVQPEYFRKNFRKAVPVEIVKVERAVDSNSFIHYPGTKRSFKEFFIPFRTSPELTANLISDTLHRKVGVAKTKLTPNARTLYSIPSDSIYKVMMHESDNHIAEQLLMMCSAVLSDSLDPKIAIRKMQETELKDVPDRLVWIDGSGLSRYNLFTPRSVVRVWEKLYQKVPQERLFSLLVTGGKPGTLKNYFKSDKPYIFGKTGTLSNNHSLSGFLVTEKGKILIFAFMNANYTTSTTEVRNNMERILKLYFEHY